MLKSIGYGAGGGGATWGTITGSLSSQTDLWNELGTKLTAADMAAHEAAANPHPVYLTPAEADALYDAIGAATAAVAAHEAAGDPHPQYLTPAEGAASFQALDATLTALAALNATAGLVEQTGTDAFTKRALGVGASTSIPTRADADGRYDAIGSAAAAQAASQPLDSDLTAIAAFSGTGFAVRTGAGTWSQRQVTSANSKIAVTNPAGVAGDVVLTIAEANFTGIPQSAVTNLVADLAARQLDIQFQDEGANAGTAGGVTTVNFTGVGVAAVESAGVLTVNVSGSGASVLSEWDFNTSTAAADPGNRRFSANNATLASVTALYFNDITKAGLDIGGLMGFLQSGYRIYIQQENDGGRLAIFQLTGAPTDNTGWWTVPVSVVNSGTLFQNNATCACLFVLSAAGGSGSPGGANGQIQYNDGGVFGGDAGLTFDDVVKQLAITSGAGATTPLLITNGTVTAAIKFGISTDRLLIGSTSNHPVAVIAGGVESLVVLDTGEVYVGSPVSGTALTVTSIGTEIGLIVDSLAGAGITPDIWVGRNASTVNTLHSGANITLEVGASLGTVLQQSGGQTELWQRNGGTYRQAAAIDPTRRELYTRVNDQSTLLEVGQRALNLISSEAAGFTLDAADNGMVIHYTGTGGHTATGFAAANGYQVVIANVGTGDLTVAPGSGTLSWLDGGSITTGNRTVPAGAVVFLNRQGGNWYGWTVSAGAGGGGGLSEAQVLGRLTLGV